MVDRGKVVEIDFSKPIIFNEEIFSAAWIEIDHINHGLDPRTKKLNSSKRSSFSALDIYQFLIELDGMVLEPLKESGGLKFFSLEMLGPIKGINMGKKYRLIFSTNKDEVGVIGTITLYRIM